MKKFLYFILLIAGFTSIHSCKDLIDEDGNPLLDLNETSGFNGPRALFREITDSDTIAEYRYNGLLLSKVITDSSSVTDVMWSGDKISKITFNGFLDEDQNGYVDKDSISYTQLFTYGNSGRLETISENRSIFKRAVPVPPSTTPGAIALFRKTKTLYDIKYQAASGKLGGISMKTGVDVPSTNFVYNAYSETAYTYVGDNVSKSERSYGAILAGVPSTATEKYSYEYFTYDTQISPYTLLPTAYKISRLLATRENDIESQLFSPNNPKRIAVTDLMVPIPSAVIFTTNYNYDAQTYMAKGFGVNFIYKPF